MINETSAHPIDDNLAPFRKTGWFSRRTFLKNAAAFTGAVTATAMGVRSAEGHTAAALDVRLQTAEAETSMERSKTHLVNQIFERMTMVDTGRYCNNGEVLPVDETEVFERLSGKKITAEELSKLKQSNWTDSQLLFANDPSAWIALFLMPGKNEHGTRVIELLQQHVAALANVSPTNLTNPAFVPIEEVVSIPKNPVSQQAQDQIVERTIEHRGTVNTARYIAQTFDVDLGRLNHNQEEQPPLLSVSNQLGIIQVEVMTHAEVPLSQQITTSDIRQVLSKNFDQYGFNRVSFHRDLALFNFKGEVVDKAKVKSYTLQYRIPNTNRSGNITFSADLKQIINGEAEFLHDNEAADWAPIVDQVVITMEDDQTYVAQTEEINSSVTVIPENQDAEDTTDSASSTTDIHQEQKVWKKLVEPQASIKGAYHPENPYREANLAQLIALAKANPEVTFVYALGNHGDQLLPQDELPPNLFMVGQLLDTDRQELAMTLNDTGGKQAVWVRLSDVFERTLYRLGSSYTTPLFAFAKAAELDGDPTWVQMIDQPLREGGVVQKFVLSVLPEKIIEAARQRMVQRLTSTRRAFLGIRKR